MGTHWSQKFGPSDLQLRVGGQVQVSAGGYGHFCHHDELWATQCFWLSGSMIPPNKQTYGGSTLKDWLRLTLGLQAKVTRGDGDTSPAVYRQHSQSVRRDRFHLPNECAVGITTVS